MRVGIHNPIERLGGVDFDTDFLLHLTRETREKRFSRQALAAWKLPVAAQDNVVGSAGDQKPPAVFDDGRGDLSG
jgi:hypothetical protein